MKVQGPRRRMSRRKAILPGIAVLAALLLSIGCGKGASAGTPTGPQAFPVKVITAQAQMVPQYTDYLATLKSRNASALQPQVEGDIVRIFVASGQRVAAGAPILEIDPRKQEAAVNNQEATYKSKLAVMQQFAVDLDRKKKLVAAGVLAQADLDKRKTPMTPPRRTQSPSMQA